MVQTFEYLLEQRILKLLSCFMLIWVFGSTGSEMTSLNLKYQIQNFFYKTTTTKNGVKIYFKLQIQKDVGDEHLQWFYFRLTGAHGFDCSLKIENAGVVSFPEGWRDYRAVASYDRLYWFRVDTEFDGKSLSIKHSPGQNSIYYAMFAPYSLERHANHLARVQNSPRANVIRLTETGDGRDLDMLTIGDNCRNKHKCWIVARQLMQSIDILRD